MQKFICLLLFLISSLIQAGPVSTKQPVFHYQILKIIGPKNQSTIHDNQGNITIQVAVSPKLRATDRVILFVDGEQVNPDSDKSLLRLKNIDRGEHVLQAGIINEKQEVLKTSGKIVIYLQRTIAQ